MSQQPSWWPQALVLKDRMSLRDLADHLGISVGALSAEFRNAGITRKPAQRNTTTTKTARTRPGSKDALIEKYFDKLGRIPDAEVAKLTGVSVRTIASYRSRNGIDGYKGPRRRTPGGGRRQSRLDDFRHLMGRVPDRVVAEQADMSLGAVRNYRIKHGIDAAGRKPTEDVTALEAEAPMTSSPPEPPHVTFGAEAWQVVFEVDGAEVRQVVLAHDLLDAARVASRVASTRPGLVAIRSLVAVGPLVD